MDEEWSVDRQASTDDQSGLPTQRRFSAPPESAGTRETRQRHALKYRYRADDGIRTRDPHLGKVMLYQLSHVRVTINSITDTPSSLAVVSM